MYYRLVSGGIAGISGQMIFIETDVSRGLPYFSMVGLLASEVKEAGERVRTAIRNTGYQVPPGRITVSLTPGNIRKEGTGYDLAIALGILCSAGLLRESEEAFFEHTVILGELGLDGSVKEIHGILPVIISAKNEGYTACIVPAQNVSEALMVRGMDVYGVSALAEAVEVTRNQRKKEKPREFLSDSGAEYDMGDVLGNEYAKRAVLAAVCGRHNILLMGQPGSGKSTIAKCIPGILEPPDDDEQMEIASVYSVCGALNSLSFPIRRPFRSPHHTVTVQAFAGGGRRPRPGEMTLAHRGVLFLDELPEFRSEVLESLREPMEAKQIHITRNCGAYRFPADFLLVGAMNNCRCGYYPDKNRCKCSENEVRKYMRKISGPLMDRMDICIQVPKVKAEEIYRNKSNRSMRSAAMQDIVKRTGRIQRKRFSGEGIRYNSEMTNEMVSRYCFLGEREERMMKKAYDSMNLSVRTYYKVIKVARTIADMEEQEQICESHLAEAISYRNTL